jgi:hypothetical protein
MKLFFKVVIVFMIIFNFRLPVVYNSVFLALGLTTVYYFYALKAIPLTYFNLRYVGTVLVSTLFIAFLFFAFTIFHGKYDYVFVKRMFIEFSMLFAIIYAFPLLIEDRESEAFELASLFICYAFALQGLIHLIGYLYPPFGEYMVSIKSHEMQGMLMDDQRTQIINFRGYALTGSLFFELPAAYGLAFLMFIRLQLIESQRYLTGYKAYAVFFLIMIGIILSGRTGFVGVGVGIALYFIFVPDPIVIFVNLLKKAAITVPFLLFVYFFLLSPTQQEGLQENVFPFAFEAFYNVTEGREFGTASTDVTMSFYFPLNDKTLVVGSGADVWSGGTSYRHTDAGYMRTIIFGGIPFLIIMIIYQYLYFSIPISLTRAYNTKKEKVAFWCFLFSFIYILVLHIKDSALGTLQGMETMYLFLGATFIIQCYRKQKPVEEADTVDMGFF